MLQMDLQNLKRDKKQVQSLKTAMNLALQILIPIKAF